MRDIIQQHALLLNASIAVGIIFKGQMVGPEVIAGCGAEGRLASECLGQGTGQAYPGAIKGL